MIATGSLSPRNDKVSPRVIAFGLYFIYIEGMIDIYSLAKNPLVFQKQRTITSAYIDVSGKMGIAQTVLMVQDNFTENFGSIKMDNFCVNEKGEITEGTFTNIGILKDGIIYTPPIECGLLNGITRQKLLNEGKAKGEILREIPAAEVGHEALGSLLHRRQDTLERLDRP